MADILSTATQKTPHTFDTIWRAVAAMSRADRKRLAERLMVEEGASTSPVFPKIAKDWKPQPVVFEMVENRLPVEIDIDGERRRMWEDWAK